MSFLVVVFLKRGNYNRTFLSGLRNTERGDSCLVKGSAFAIINTIMPSDHKDDEDRVMVSMRSESWLACS